jgi:GNAT superfamily N-acetyltransferase
VRTSGPQDVGWAAPAAALIREAARSHDIAVRSEELLRSKLRSGRAVLGFFGQELVGFGYYSEWEGGRFLSHSGLVVRPDMRGKGLGRALKLALFEASRVRFPKAIVMSLTTSPEVMALNSSLGFVPVPFEDMTKDEEFWKGCETCRNWEEAKRLGQQCCCQGMILTPDSQPPQAEDND